MIRWQRGLLRLWVVISLAWAGALALVLHPLEQISTIREAWDLPPAPPYEPVKLPPGVEPDIPGVWGRPVNPNPTPEDTLREKADEAQEVLLSWLKFAFGVPMALLVAGVLTGWVVKGFRPNRA